MNEYTVYRGKYICPKCGSPETGTNIIATSERWMIFHCDGCGHDFRRSSVNTSTLSRSLSGFAKVLNAGG